MVSVTVLALALVGAQQQPAGAGFRPEARRDAPPPAAKPAAPANVISAEMRGDIFMARKMYREALEAYRTGPQDSAVLINKTGIAYHQLLELRTAKKYYERAIRLDPKYSEAINNLGTVYYAQKSYRRSISQYKRALRFSPDSASIYSNLGTSYFARHNYKAAVEAYQKALAIDPDVFEHHSATGVLLQERSVADRARFHYTMAKMYAKAGQNERSLMYIRKALEEGFKDRKKFEEEPEFAGLRNLQEFRDLMASQPRVL